MFRPTLRRTLVRFPCRPADTFGKSDSIDHAPASTRMSMRFRCSLLLFVCGLVAVSGIAGQAAAGELWNPAGFATLLARLCATNTAFTVQAAVRVVEREPTNLPRLTPEGPTPDRKTASLAMEVVVLEGRVRFDADTAQSKGRYDLIDFQGFCGDRAFLMRLWNVRFTKPDPGRLDPPPTYKELVLVLRPGL